MKRAIAVTVVLFAVTIGGGTWLLRRPAAEVSPCGAGFARVGPRCCPGAADPSTPPGTCRAPTTGACPAPLVATDRGCDAPAEQVEVPATTVTVGPSDWEAEGRAPPRTIAVGGFRIDRFEVTVGQACASRALADRPFCREGDPARAAFGVPLEEARELCRERGGRLPSEDEWLVAAAGDRPRRYPWGDTGAVCRRAAWGLAKGPCADGASGPDTVGAHPDGATPLGIHDLAGNVEEWVEPPDRSAGAGALLRGGSWQTAFAAELRTWPRREASASEIRDPGPTIGFRCAYGGIP